MKKILILRFSAMGDVVLLVPVLRSLVAAHQEVEVTVATRPRFASFFEGIERVSVFEADVDHQYTGLLGLRRLFKRLQTYSEYSFVIDIHDHVRTMMLRNLFRLAGKKVIIFRKGREEKNAFVRKENKVTRPLPHTVDRYRAALKQAGFNFTMIPGPYLIPANESEEKLKSWLDQNTLAKNEKWIGLAPFALHTSKVWPLANYPQLIDEVIKHHNARIFLFGGGEKEINYFNDVQQLFPDRCTVVAGQLKMPEEIALMHELDLMICTDSSNMHLAALSGTPLLSIWGGTHPEVGFAPYGQGEKSILQISRNELPCRPCSVYGTETCHRGDFACLTRIGVQDVVDRVNRILGATS
jgi:ADP-heptose:LPS heptosyltransferase